MSPAGQRYEARRPLLTGFAITLILVAMVSVPYLFPAPLSISRSYVAGFNNRAAVLILIFGTGALGLWIRGRMARWELKDSTLGVGWLLLALGVTLAQCLKITALMSRLPGSEGIYFANRLQLLLVGKVPYKDFEFPYGPLLMYPPAWLKSLTHASLVKSYDAVWLGFWIIGVFLIWLIVRWVDLPVPRRPLLFLLLVGAQLSWAGYGGLSYTSLRAYSSAACIVVTHRLGKRTGNLWLTALAGVLSVAFTLGISMDHAIGATLGVSVVMFLLVLSSVSATRWLAFAAFVAGVLGCYLWAQHAGVTALLSAFAGGGYAYPLLPSFPIFTVLFTYIVAGCALCRALFARFANNRGGSPESIDGVLSSSVLIPLALAGCSMIPAPLGRCDLLHITAAIPLFVIGMMVAFAMPAVFRWFLPASVLALLIFPFTFHRVLEHLPHHVEPPDPKLVAQGYTAAPIDNQFYESPGQPASSSLPCDRQYFSPSLMPNALLPFRPQCLDTGYYLGLTDVMTPAIIHDKVNELKERPTVPLLMEDIPLEAQLPIQLGRMQSLYRESESFWVPPARHAPLTYAEIIDYIREHYVQGPSPSKGLRIWYPKAT